MQGMHKMESRVRAMIMGEWLESRMTIKREEIVGG